jgi:hypothetical protein
VYVSECSKQIHGAAQNTAGLGNNPLISPTLHIFVLQKKVMSIG